MSMWNLLRPETEPIFPALAGKFLSTAPPAKSLEGILELVSRRIGFDLQQQEKKINSALNKTKSSFSLKETGLEIWNTRLVWRLHKQVSNAGSYQLPAPPSKVWPLTPQSSVAARDPATASTFQASRWRMTSRYKDRSLLLHDSLRGFLEHITQHFGFGIIGQKFVM